MDAEPELEESTIEVPGEVEALVRELIEVVALVVAQIPDVDDSVEIDGAVAIAEDAKVDDSRLGPNVSVGAGSRIRGCGLKDTIVGESSVLEGCALTDSIVGDHVVLRGVQGKVNIGDHSEVEGRLE